MRRRASRLIPITVSPLKPKIRQLILTSHRLVCVKQRDRGILSMKSELAFRPPISMNGTGGNHTNGTSSSGKDKDKDKDSRTFIVGVEAKTDNEFVVLTVRPPPSSLPVELNYHSNCCFFFPFYTHSPANPRPTQHLTSPCHPHGSTRSGYVWNHTRPNPYGHDR